MANDRIYYCTSGRSVNPNSILTKIQQVSWWARSLKYLAHQDTCCENHQFNSGIYTEKHWTEAQDQQRKVGGNVVFTSDGKAAITGYPGMGWLIVTPELSLQAQTMQGVDLVLEELDLAPLGWG